MAVTDLQDAVVEVSQNSVHSGYNDANLLRSQDVSVTDLQDVVVVVSQELLHNGDTGVNLLWHQRYGHLSFQHLPFLSRLEMVVGIPFIHEKEGICAACLREEQHKEVVDIGVAWRANIVLALYMWTVLI